MPNFEEGCYRPSFDGTFLWCRTWKEKSDLKGVCLILHGLGEFVGLYDGLAQFLSASGYRVYGFDQRGHGFTWRRNGHECFSEGMDKLVHDSQFILESDEDYKEQGAFIIGHSMGGLFALYYAIFAEKKAKIRAVVSIAPPIRPIVRMSKIKFALLRTFARAFPKIKVDAGFDISKVTHNQEYNQWLSCHPLFSHKVSLSLAMDIIETGKKIKDFGYSKLAVPALVLIGTEDCFVSYEACVDFCGKLSQSYQGPGACELEIFQNGYHDLKNDIEQEKFRTRIAEFLSKY